jgi:hypothetical protein
MLCEYLKRTQILATSAYIFFYLYEVKNFHLITNTLQLLFGKSKFQHHYSYTLEPLLSKIRIL